MTEPGSSALRPYADLHCDTLSLAWHCGAEDIFSLNGAMADLSKLRAGGCHLQLFAIFMPPPEEAEAPDYPGDDAYIEALRTIFARTVQRHAELLAPAKSLSDVEENATRGLISGMLSLEDGRAVRGSFDNLRALYDAGIRVLGLTWNHANCFGFPNSPDPEIMGQGLTPFGREAIPFMESLGMLIDVSHLSDGGFWDVVHLSRRPFIASHSNCRTINPHPRSMTDDMIRALADRGGVMGLNFCPAFLTQDTAARGSAVDDLARQLRHRIRVGGLECAAIGTDFDGISGDLEIPSADRMPFLFEALQQRGFTSLELDHLCWQNVSRVLREFL